MAPPTRRIRSVSSTTPPSGVGSDSGCGRPAAAGRRGRRPLRSGRLARGRPARPAGERQMRRLRPCRVAEGIDQADDGDLGDCRSQHGPGCPPAGTPQPAARRPASVGRGSSTSEKSMSWVSAAAWAITARRSAAEPAAGSSSDWCEKLDGAEQAVLQIGKVPLGSQGQIDVAAAARTRPSQ